jgi:hypothetical protein
VSPIPLLWSLRRQRLLQLRLTKKLLWQVAMVQLVAMHLVAAVMAVLAVT